MGDFRGLCDLLGLLKFLGEDLFDLVLGLVEQGFGWDVRLSNLHQF